MAAHQIISRNTRGGRQGLCWPSNALKIAQLAFSWAPRSRECFYFGSHTCAVTAVEWDWQQLSKLLTSNTCSSIGWVAAVARFMRILTAGAYTAWAEGVRSMQCEFNVDICVQYCSWCHKASSTLQCCACGVSQCIVGVLVLQHLLVLVLQHLYTL